MEVIKINESTIKISISEDEIKNKSTIEMLTQISNETNKFNIKNNDKIILNIPDKLKEEINKFAILKNHANKSNIKATDYGIITISFLSTYLIASGIFIYIVLMDNIKFSFLIILLHLFIIDILVKHYRLIKHIINNKYNS